jgi:hypothetical protein
MTRCGIDQTEWLLDESGYAGVETTNAGRGLVTLVSCAPRCIVEDSVRTTVNLTPGFPR